MTLLLVINPTSAYVIHEWFQSSTEGEAKHNLEINNASAQADQIYPQLIFQANNIHLHIYHTNRFTFLVCFLSVSPVLYTVGLWATFEKQTNNIIYMLWLYTKPNDVHDQTHTNRFKFWSVFCLWLEVWYSKRSDQDGTVFKNCNGFNFTQSFSILSYFYQT